MISNFFVISPRGDTIIAKDYRSDRGDVGAHERSHTEAFFRKIKFYGQDGGAGEDQHPKEKEEAKRKAQAPPVFIMPDGLSYFHVQRNGLIFGCSTARNVSPTTVVQVGSRVMFVLNAVE
jgi:AP-4 complex subunit mu-1